jgi:hypothetical protein
MHSKYSGCAVSLLAFLPLMLNGQWTQENVVPLKNWSTPLFWQPSQAEREVAAKDVPQLRFSANAVSTNALTFVAITPCRLVDTRGIAAGFNGISPFSGPSIPAGGTITIPRSAISRARVFSAREDEERAFLVVQQMDQEVELGALLDFVAEEIYLVGRRSGGANRNSHGVVHVSVDKVSDRSLDGRRE